MILLIGVIVLLILVLVFSPGMKFPKFRKGMGEEKKVENAISGKNVMVYKKFWTVKEVRDHPDWLFVYGDNDLKLGKGGQAIIRGEPNAMGIPTKKKPDEKEGSFYTDSEIDENRKKIKNAVNAIKAAMSKYTTLVLPRDGLGTGRAELNKRAPNTFGYLQYQIKNLVEDVEPGSSDNVSFLRV